MDSPPRSQPVVLPRSTGAPCHQGWSVSAPCLTCLLHSELPWSPRVESAAASLRSFRITLVGGSAADTGLLSDEQCLAARIQHHLGASDRLARPVHVQAFTKSLVDAQALLRLMRATFPRLPRQDVILLMTGASDLIRWLHAGAPDGRPAPTLPPSEYLAQYPEMPFHVGSPALRHLVKFTAFRWLRLRVERGRKPPTPRERAARRDAHVLIRLESEPSGVLGSYRRSLADLIELSQGFARRVVLIRQGLLGEKELTMEEEAAVWLGRLGPPGTSVPARFVATAELCRLLRLVNQVACEVADHLGVSIVDLGQVTADLVHYYDDAHFTAVGADCAAELIAATILGGTRPIPGPPRHAEDHAPRGQVQDDPHRSEQPVVGARQSLWLSRRYRRVRSHRSPIWAHAPGTVRLHLDARAPHRDLSWSLRHGSRDLQAPCRSLAATGLLRRATRPAESRAFNARSLSRPSR